jgi:hypothetical protein
MDAEDDATAKAPESTDDETSLIDTQHVAKLERGEGE